MATKQQLESQLAELRSRLARLEQERQETLTALATNRDVAATNQDSLARAQALGDTGRVELATRLLEINRELTTELTATLQREERSIEELQTSIRALETEIRATADQGPGTESAGATVSQDQQANADGANTQAPASGPEVAGPDGDVGTAQTATPSNADPSVPVDPTAPDAPGTLPPGSTEGFASDGKFRVNVTGVGEIPNSAYAGVGDGAIGIEDTNNNLVSYIYKATRVVSSFRQGKFTQDIEGVQIFFQLPPRAGARSATQVQTRQNNTVSANSPAIPQGTVEQTVTTPDSINGPVIYADQVSAEFAAFTGTGEIPPSTRAPVVPFSAPASTFDAFGFSDPTADQIATVAPLITNPPTTGVAGSVLAPLARTGNVSTTSNTAPQRGAKEY